MARIVILGGGFGGLTVAHALRPALERGHAITLIDRRDRFLMGLAKLWILTGQRPPEEGRGDLAGLERKGIRFVQTDVTAIDLASCRVLTTAGEEPYDHLVIALGAETAPEAVPGLPPESNLYDASQVPGLRDRLRRMTAGRLALVVCASPYKCPPAPFEAVLLVDALLRERGVRDHVGIEVTLPDPQPMPVAGPEAAARVQALFEERGIGLRSSARPVSVDDGAGEVRFADGEALRYDLLLAVPPHRAPRVVQEAGLTDASGWIPVHPSTLDTAHPRVHAVGDVCAVKLPGAGFLPKAGIMAERQGEVVAARVLAALEGGASEREFDGEGYCFFEVGGGKAMQMEGSFFAEPGKRVRFSDPAAEAYALKVKFERDRLARWFG